MLKVVTAQANFLLKIGSLRRITMIKVIQCLLRVLLRHDIGEHFELFVGLLCRTAAFKR